MLKPSILRVTRPMHGLYPFALVLILALLTNLGLSEASDTNLDQRYSSPDTRAVIEKMIAAHGGMERWRGAPAVSFLRKATFAARPDHPWLLHETIEQGRRRLFQSWPNDGILLANDGHEVWTVNWKVPFPPRFVAQIGFYFLNMPWITQDPGVILETIEPGTHPGSDMKYLKVAMSFEPGTGDTPGDRYVLYIDQDSYLLSAIEYHVSYGALLDAAYLPPSIKSIGPFYHVNLEFEEFDGLKVPVRYTVHGVDGSVSIDGEVSDWAFTEHFDESNVNKPAGAVVDSSSPQRRMDQ